MQKILRMIAACLKILTDIEREGDQCADVCEILSTGQVYGNSLIVSKIIQMMEAARYVPPRYGCIYQS